jgi:hypothetical protein
MGCMGISDLAIIRCVFHINAAKKKISIHNFDFGFGKIIDAVASLNPPVARGFETSALQTSLPVDAARALPDNKH